MTTLPHAMLSLNDVSVELPNGKPLLQNIMLDIEPGERIGIYGPNGAGKTTLLSVMLGYLKPTTGRVEFKGRDIQNYPASERAHQIGYLPQSLPTLPKIQVRDLLSSLAEQYDAYNRIDTVIERFCLKSLLDQFLETLSGGEVRRVFIAASQLTPCSLLLCDEPLVSLDEDASRETIESLYHAIQLQPEMALVVTSHDQTFLEAISTRRIYIDSGQINSSSNISLSAGVM